VKIMILNNQHLGMVVQWEDRFYKVSERPYCAGEGCAVGVPYCGCAVGAWAYCWWMYCGCVGGREKKGKKKKKRAPLLASLPAAWPF